MLRFLPRVASAALLCFFPFIALAQIPEAVKQWTFATEDEWTVEAGSASLQSLNHSGNSKSMMLTRTATQQRVYLRESAPIRPFNSYRLTFWAYSDNNQSSLEDLRVRVLELQAGAPYWHRGDADSVLVKIGGDRNWTKYEATLRANNGSLTGSTAGFKSATTSLRPYFYLEGNANALGARFYIDDVRIEKINMAVNADFEAKQPFSSLSYSGQQEWAQTGHESQRSLKLKGGGTYTAATYTLTDVINRDAELGGYQLGFWAKSTVADPTKIRVGVKMQPTMSSPNAWFNDRDDLFVIPGDGQWRYYSIDIYPLEMTDFITTKLELNLRLNAGTQVGEDVWFDDFVVTQMHRDNFVWGVNLKSAGNSSVYGVEGATNNVTRSRDTGATYLRVDFRCPEVETYKFPNCKLTEWDTLVAEARAKGMKVFLVLFDKFGSSESIAEWEQFGTAIATHFKGKIAYYQLGNELDVVDSNGGGGIPMNDNTPGKPCDGDCDGWDAGDWQTGHDRFLPFVNKINALHSTIKAADPSAQTVVNFSFMHYGLLEAFEIAGADWDVTAVDFYIRQAADINGPLGAFDQVMDHLQAKGRPYFVAEQNIDHGSCDPVTASCPRSEAEQGYYVRRGANRGYYGDPTPTIGAEPWTRFMGYIVYELYNRPDRPGYGLMKKATDGSILKKDAYNRYQTLINSKK